MPVEVFGDLAYRVVIERSHQHSSPPLHVCHAKPSGEEAAGSVSRTVPLVPAYRLCMCQRLSFVNAPQTCEEEFQSLATRAAEREDLKTAFREVHRTQQARRSLRRFLHWKGG